MTNQQSPFLNVTSATFAFFIENEVRISSAIVKYRDFTDSLIKAKIMGLLTPGAVNLMAKYHISASS